MNRHFAKLRCLFQNFVNLFTESIFFVAVALFFQLASSRLHARLGRVQANLALLSLLIQFIDPRLFLDDVNDYEVDFVIAL